MEGMVDSGAGGYFVDQNFARNTRLPLQKLTKPLTAYNVDGTQNKKGTITHKTDLIIDIHGRKRRKTFYVTGLGRQKLILGYPWLKEENP